MNFAKPQKKLQAPTFDIRQMMLFRVSDDISNQLMIDMAVQVFINSMKTPLPLLIIIQISHNGMKRMIKRAV